MKAIDVRGFRYQDIVVYLSGVLAALGEKVYVRDMSTDVSMHDYLPHIPGAGGDAELEFRGVTYVQGAVSVAPECTYCINLWDPMGSGCVKEDTDDGFSLYVTDEEPAHEKNMDYSLRFTACGNGRGQQPYLVIRDYTGVTSKRLSGILAGGGKAKICRLPYSEKDRKAELYLTVREDTGVKGVSEKMSCLIEELACSIRPETSSSQFEKAYRRMLKGGSR